MSDDEDLLEKGREIQRQLWGQRAGGGVGHEFRHHQRTHASGAAFEKTNVLALDFEQSADPASDDDAAALRYFGGELQSRRLHGFLGRHESEL